MDHYAGIDVSLETHRAFAPWTSAGKLVFKRRLASEPEALIG